MVKCRICGSELLPFISFGQMPIANGFLRESSFADEFFFELAVAFCTRCQMTQLLHPVEQERLFHENYAFYSSTSVRMAEHFERHAQAVHKHLSGRKDPFVLEIGSNDGILLRHFSVAGVRHLGIEPSANVAEVARNAGVQTVSEFFTEQLAVDILRQHGEADAILAANVMCHIPYLHDVFSGVKTLLAKNGLFVFEDPYMGAILEKTSYDQIYDEHAYYFSLHSIQYLSRKHGLEVVDVEALSVHGGSMRYTLSHDGEVARSEAVDALEAAEIHQQMHRAESYDSLRCRIEHSRNNLIETVSELRDQGKQIVGYGATSKSTTVINYCGFTSKEIEYISDTTPIKQGKFSPGAHIPILSYGRFLEKYPDVALLFAWNHSDEIMAKEKGFRDAGGRWLTYIPEVRIFS